MGSGCRRDPSCGQRALAVPRREEEAAVVRVAEQLDGQQGQPVAPRAASAPRRSRRGARGGRAPHLRSRPEMRRRPPGPDAMSDAAVRPPVRAGRGGTLPPPAPQRASPAGRAVAPPPRERRGPGRSTRRAPCRRGRVGGGGSAPLSNRAFRAGSSSPRMIERPCSKGCSRTRGTPSSSVQVNVNPSTPIGVCVLGRREPASLEAKLAQHVADGLLGDAGTSVPVATQAWRYTDGQQRVVVEHLLEVRHQPAVVDRIAMEATADEVVHPARGHAVEGRRHHRGRLRRAASQEQLEHGRRRELRRPAEPAESGLEGTRDTALRLGKQGRCERSDDGRRRDALPIASTSLRACCAISSRRSFHASATARSSCGNDGRPWRGSGGKYVPA